MTLADYYDRSATAISQVVAGFNPSAFRSLVEGTRVGVSFGDDTSGSAQGRATLDMTVRLLARLYPALIIRTAPGAAAATTRLAATARSLARRVNPNIDVAGTANTGVNIGAAVSPWEQTVYAGCSDWAGSASLTGPQHIGQGDIVFGAGVAACLAAAALFRLVLTPTSAQPADTTLNVFGNSEVQPPPGPLPRTLALPERTMLVGAGAIGQASAWALARTAAAGSVIIVDHEEIDLGNLQRYVLTGRKDVGRQKALLAASHINRVGAARGGPRVHAVPVPGRYVDALIARGYQWDAALAAVDSAADRRAIQATLPRWAANAWTQTGDLGISDHHYRAGACIGCLYLPQGPRPNHDEVVAEALRVPDQAVLVRRLLYLGGSVPDELCDLISVRLGLDRLLVGSFADRGIRAMYVDGICGGGLVALGTQAPVAELHVPLAHQSALAGVLLGARLVRRALGLHPETTEVMRLDVSRDISALTVQPAAKDPRGICLCQDEAFTGAYDRLWSQRT